MGYIDTVLSSLMVKYFGIRYFGSWQVFSGPLSDVR